MGITQKHWYRFTFLKSDRWRDFRLGALLHHGQFCHLCRSDSKTLDIHHIWYPKRVEQVWDVRPLCRECHDLAHVHTNPGEYTEIEEALAEYHSFIDANLKIPDSNLKKWLKEKEDAASREVEKKKKFLKDAVRQKDLIIAHSKGDLKSSERVENLQRWMDANRHDPDFVMMVKQGAGVELKSLTESIDSV